MTQDCHTRTFDPVPFPMALRSKVPKHLDEPWIGTVVSYSGACCQSEPLLKSKSQRCTVRRPRNISPHHFHPRILVKYGLISWSLAETALRPAMGFRCVLSFFSRALAFLGFEDEKTGISKSQQLCPSTEAPNPNRLSPATWVPKKNV